jgi:glycosyltransferase involved in cell wall biosynthesis
MEKKTPRILLVAPMFPPDYGGGGSQAWDLAKGLCTKGISVTGLAGTTTQGPSPIHLIRVRNLVSYRIFHNPESSFLGKFTYIIRFIYMLSILTRHCDIVHFFGSRFYPFIGTPMVKLLRKRVVATITLMDSDDPRTLAQGLIGKLRLLIIHGIDFWVGLTTEAIKSCISVNIPLSKTDQIPIGIDTSIFQPLSHYQKQKTRHDHDIPNNIIVTFAGILCYRKGIDIITRAIPLVIESVPDISFILVGPMTKEDSILVDLDLVSKLQNLERKFPGKVILKGFVDSAIDYIQVADIFVLPSRKEGMAISFIEALGSGVPVVITDHPWLSDVGTDSVHFQSFENHSPTLLASEIIRLANDSERRDQIGKAACMRIQEHFSHQAITEKYLQLYSRTL